MNYVYILKCSDGKLYTGWTNNLEKRIKVHNNGKASRCTRARLPVNLVYWEAYPTRSEAMKREVKIKSLKRIDKERLVDGDNEFTYICEIKRIE